MDTTYTVTPAQDDLQGRLRVDFSDPTFFQAVRLRCGGVQRVSVREGFALAVPEAEAALRAVLDNEALIRSPAYIAEQEAKRAAVQEARDADAQKKAKAATKRASNAAAKHADAFPIHRGFSESKWTVAIPYASGAPAILRAAGCDWNATTKRWLAPTQSVVDAVRARFPELVKLVSAQQRKDAKTRGEVMGVGARWNLTNADIVREIGYLPRTEAGMQDAYGTSDY